MKKRFPKIKKNPKKERTKKGKRKKAVKKPRVKALRGKVKKTAKKTKTVKPKKKTKRTKKIFRKTKKIFREKAKKSVRKKTKKSRPRSGPRQKLKKTQKTKKVKAPKPRTYIGKGLLEQLFESQPKVKLLKFFFRNHQDVFTLKQIFRRLRTKTSLIRREIGKMEKLGLIKHKKAWLTIERKKRGTQKEQKTVYYINGGFDFFNELKNLVLKSTISSKEELINNVRKLGNIKILALAGIFTGDETAKADILIVGDKINSRKINTFFKDLEAEVGKELNCSIMSTREFNYRYDMYDRFVRDLLGGKSEILINKINLW